MLFVKAFTDNVRRFMVARQYYNQEFCVFPRIEIKKWIIHTHNRTVPFACLQLFSCMVFLFFWKSLYYFSFFFFNRLVFYFSLPVEEKNALIFLLFSGRDSLVLINFSCFIIIKELQFRLIYFKRLFVWRSLCLSFFPEEWIIKESLVCVGACVQ